MMKNEVDEQTSRNGRPSAPVSPVGAARSTRAGEGATPSAVLAGSILLTGPTGGLGGALLEAIARRQPHHLILLGRAFEQFEATKTLARKVGATAVSLIHVDLADLDDVARAGEEAKGLGRRATSADFDSSERGACDAGAYVPAWLEHAASLC